MLPWYFASIAVAALVIVIAAALLYRLGRTFLIAALAGNIDAACAINSLILGAFCAINLGDAALALHPSFLSAYGTPTVELICDRVAIVLIMVGVTFYFSLFVLSRIRPER